MEFMEKLEVTANRMKSYTENGALGYATSGKELLDLNFKVSSLRGANESDMFDMFTKAYYEDKELAVKWLFFARDILEGMGERRLFIVMFRCLLHLDNDKAIPLMKYIPKYGRWDDLFKLYGVNDKANDEIIRIVELQLKNDLDNKNKNKSISLMAKWMPTMQASNNDRKRLAFEFSKRLHMSHREYRKTISELRKYLDIVERKMCAKEWDKIDYEKVPSIANLKYTDAFLRNDKERREEYFKSLSKGESKINSSVAFPHHIVRKYFDTSRWDWNASESLRHLDSTLEEMWKSLPDLLNGESNTICVADGSGSMYSVTDFNSNVMAIDVANSLAIYFAEHSKGQFHNKYITFSKNPRFVNLNNADTLRDKLHIAYSYNEVSNTDIERTFDLLLNTALKHNIPQDDMPKRVLMLSDMEFDCCVYGSKDKTLFEDMSDKWSFCGYKLPKLVFWNICGRTNAVPIQENDLGVALVSGFSPNVLKMVLNEETDAYKALKDILMSDRYKDITLK